MPAATPVAASLQLLEPRLNQAIADSASARKTCEALTNKSFALTINGLHLRILCRVHDGQLKLDKDTAGTKADAEISGPPFSLMRMLKDNPQDVIREGAVKLTGDTDVADDFQLLFNYIKPELEEVLSRIVGDSVARQVTLLADELGGWLGGAKRSMGRSTADYLQEESRDLPAVAEVEEFGREVSTLAQAVDRAEARLKIIKKNLNAS